jgi:hypothetical protein
MMPGTLICHIALLDMMRRPEEFGWLQSSKSRDEPFRRGKLRSLIAASCSEPLFLRSTFHLDQRPAQPSDAMDSNEKAH